MVVFRIPTIPQIKAGPPMAGALAIPRSLEIKIKSIQSLKYI